MRAKLSFMIILVLVVPVGLAVFAMAMERLESYVLTD